MMNETNLAIGALIVYCVANIPLRLLQDSYEIML